jgi:nitrate reductase NapAB chaperone NapD
MEIYNELYRMEGVQKCEAVRGDFDIIVLAQASSEEEIRKIREKIGAMEGVDISSMSSVERPKLDRDVDKFVKIYAQAMKRPSQVKSAMQPGTMSYIIVDVDPEAIQQIFTTVFFIDEVIFCDMIEGGKKLVGMITSEGMGRKSTILEKLNEIDGVLRVREATVIKLVED